MDKQEKVEENGRQFLVLVKQTLPCIVISGPHFRAAQPLVWFALLLAVPSCIFHALMATLPSGVMEPGAIRHLIHTLYVENTSLL